MLYFVSFLGAKSESLLDTELVEALICFNKIILTCLFSSFVKKMARVSDGALKESYNSGCHVITVKKEAKE